MLAVGAGVALGASAQEGVQLVDARSTIGARVVRTCVPVCKQNTKGIVEFARVRVATL